MGARVISFRVDDEVQAELEKRRLPDESVMLTAQRVLSEALGVVKNTQYQRVEDYVDMLVEPLREELEKIRNELTLLEDAYNQDVPVLKNSVWLLERTLIATQATAIANNSDPNILPTAIATNLPPSIPPSAIDRLRELLDPKQYPSNRFAKLRDAIAEIIGEIERSHQ